MRLGDLIVSMVDNSESLERTVVVRLVKRDIQGAVTHYKHVPIGLVNSSYVELQLVAEDDGGEWEPA